MFDPSKPYGRVSGSAGDARFEQNGKLYDGVHREVRLVETSVRDDYGVVTAVVTTEVVSRPVKTAPDGDETTAPDDGTQKRRGRPPKVEE